MKWAVALVVPAVWVATVRAADEPAVPEGTTVKLLLLRQKSVQQELGLDAATIQKIMAFTNAQSEAGKKALEQGEAAAKVFDELARKNEQFLTDTLTPQQNKRLHQITLQFTALHQLTKPEMIKDLNLSDEQVQKIKELQKEARKALVALLYAREREGRSEKLAKLREETRMKVLDLMTDAQKTKIAEIAGPQFKGEIVFEEPDDK
jgi:hypothetical protein